MVRAMSYSVLFRQFPLERLDEFAPIVRQAYGVTDYDARNKIRKGWGFLERDATEETARKLSGWFGDAVTVLDNSALRQPGEPQTMTTFEPEKIQWPDVALVAAGGFPEEIIRRDTGEEFKTGKMLMGMGVFMATGIPMGMFGGKGKKQQKPVKSTRLITFGSVITRQGEQLFFSPDKFDFSGLGAQKQLNAAANFHALITECKQRASARLNLGAQFVLANKSLTLANYQGLRDYETELLWLLNTS